MSDARPKLAEEARYLYHSLFSEPLDEVVIRRYQAAHEQLFSNEERALIDRVVDLGLDVEAVEMALRRRGLGKELTRKIQILCYLLEVRAAYQNYFVATRTEPVRAAFAVLHGAIRTVWLLLMGEFLIRKYGLK